MNKRNQPYAHDQLVARRSDQAEHTFHVRVGIGITLLAGIGLTVGVGGGRPLLRDVDHEVQRILSSPDRQAQADQSYAHNVVAPSIEAGLARQGIILTGGLLPDNKGQ